MSRRAPLLVCASLCAVLIAAAPAAARADAIDPCSLLSNAEGAELGVPQGTAPQRETQPGGVQACSYRFRAPGAAADSSVSVILAQAVPERARELRAMQAMAKQQSTPAQMQARGEYVEGDVTCKVILASQRQTSQCIGATQTSVVALAIGRPGVDDGASYPATQLRIIASLVSRVAASEK